MYSGDKVRKKGIDADVVVEGVAVMDKSSILINVSIPSIIYSNWFKIPQMDLVSPSYRSSHCMHLSNTASFSNRSDISVTNSADHSHEVRRDIIPVKISLVSVLLLSSIVFTNE